MISSRSGWLLELLTELINKYHHEDDNDNDDDDDNDDDKDGDEILPSSLTVRDFGLRRDLHQ